MTLPGLSEFGFSIKAFAAGTLALWIALYLNLDRPYWALMTVYLLMQPLSGAVRSKGFYRLGGTVAAAAMTLGIVGLFANVPLALFVAVAFAELGMIYLAAFDRTPRRYAFLIGGITIAVIGFPSVTAPLAVFPTAVARTEEISIGVFCATLVDAVIFPHSAGPTLNAQTRSWLEEAEHRIRDVLGRPVSAAVEEPGFSTFAAAAAQMIALSTQVHYDTAARPPPPRIVRLLHKRMLTLLPLLSSARELVSAFRQGGGGEPTEVRDVLNTVQEWVGRASNVASEETERVRAAVASIAPSDHALGEWHSILLTSLRRVLALLMSTWEDCKELHRAVETGELPSARLVRAARREVLLVPYNDKLVPLFAVFPVAIALLAVGGLWTATAWSEGLLAAEFTMIGYGLMSIQADPVAGLRLYLGVIIGASCLEFIYLFGVLPAVNGFVPLMFALGLLLLPLGAFLPIPATALPAMILAAMTIAFLSLQDVYTSNFIISLNATLGIVGGLIAALVTATVIGGPGSEFNARRLLRASRADLGAIASGRWLPDTEVYGVRALDRTMQLAPRMEGKIAPGGVPAGDPFADTRVGMYMLRLWANRRDLGTAADAALGRALATLAAHFSRPPPTQADTALLGRIDASLRVLVGIPPSVAKRDAVMALAGVRRALFPDAPPVAGTAAEDRGHAT